MSDPFSGGFDPRIFQNVPLFRELAKVMSWTGGAVNWELAEQTAQAIVAPAGESVVPERDSAELRQAVQVAELWLDEVTALTAPAGTVRALGRAEWVRLATSPAGLGVYVEPVAEAMARVLGESMPAELAALGPQLGQAMSALGAMLYGLQIGTVAGHLAGQLLGTYDLGVPTVDPLVVGTVGDAAVRFAADYDFDRTEFGYWLALREAAHRRQFGGVAWLRDHLAGLVRRFASQGEFDANALLEQFGTGMDPMRALGDPEAFREALEAPDAFRVEPTAAQRETLHELQALIAFIAAWADVAVESAAGSRLPALPRIEEAIQRRRAEKGPGERFLQQLIGLDLRPADRRQAQAFCRAVIAARGQEGLDRAWRSPDHLPAPPELADASRWLLRMAARELDEGDGATTT